MIDKQRGYRASNKMRELISDNAMLLPAISRFGISFGFGDGSVEFVCRENNVHAGTFLCVQPAQRIPLQRLRHLPFLFDALP